MCLIIHKPAGVEIPAALIRSAWEDNSDGAGIMFQRPGAISASILKVLPKQMPDPAEYLSAILKDLNDHEVGVHFRWRTHGPIDTNNTHPYPLPNAAGWLMHNGVLAPNLLGPTYSAVSDILSDTGFYVLSTLQNCPGAGDSEFWEIVGRDVGSYNKMLILDAAGKFLRVNDKQWEDYEGLKLSNIMSCPEYATGSKWWRGYRVDYSTDYTPPSASVTGAGSDIVEVLVGTPAAPARLTRRERKVLNACLRAGNWGPFKRLGK